MFKNDNDKLQSLINKIYSSLIFQFRTYKFNLFGVFFFDILI